MKQFTFLVLISLFLVTGCKKKYENAFLTGQLFDDCSGGPLANETVYLYQNYVPAPNWLQSETPTALLETAKTDENGKFYFWADGYTNDYTVSKSNISVRLDKQTTLVTGTMGNAQGKKSDQSQDYVQDIGKIYKSPTVLSFTVLADTAYNGVSLDSMTFTTSQFEYITTTFDKSSGQFEFIYSSDYIQPLIIEPIDPSSHFKHQVLITYSCYGNGSKLYFKHHYEYISSCGENQVVILDFDE